MTPHRPELLEAVARLADADGLDPIELATRVAWSIVVEPGDAIAGGLVDALGPASAFEVVLAAADDGIDAMVGMCAERGVAGTDDLPAYARAATKAIDRWRPRLASADVGAVIAAADAVGARLLVPDAPGWPVGLDDLGHHAPLVLWSRSAGRARTALTVAPTVAVVGSRANTVAGAEAAADVTSRAVDAGCVVVSGGAYGIDAVAHRVAIAAGAPTVAVLAGGVDQLYPAGNVELLRNVAQQGAVIAESPPGTRPSRWRFLATYCALDGTSLSTMTRAAIYARQSKENDEGIERQLRRTRALAAARDWEVVAEFSDNDVSASKPRGPQSDWAAMLAAAEAQAFTHVVAVDLDRLVRSQADLIRLMERKLAVVTVDGEIDLSTADGEFRASLGASLARFEVRRKAERTKRANEERRINGRLTPGRRLFGYETDGLTIRESEAAVVRRVYAHVAEGGSVYSIAKALRDEAVPFTTGSPESWRPARVRDMIFNRRYSGQVFAPVGADDNVKGWARAKQRRDPAAWVPGNVPALVDDATADQARAVLNDPTRKVTPGPARRHLLSGIAVCGECGAGLKQVHGDYRCSAMAAHPTIRARSLEEYVKHEVVYAMSAGGPSIVTTAADVSGLSAAVAAYKENEDKQAQVLALQDAGLLTAPVVADRLGALKTERDALTATLERLRTEQSAASALVALATELLDGLPGAYAAMARQGAGIREQVAARFDALDLDQQREVIRATVAVQVDRGRGVGRVRVHHLLADQFNAGDAWADVDADERP